MTITDTDVARLAELLSRATPGKWQTCIICGVHPGDHGRKKAFSLDDFALIAAARNLLPGLLAEREKLRAVADCAHTLLKLRSKQLAMSDDYNELWDALNAAGIGERSSAGETDGEAFPPAIRAAFAKVIDFLESRPRNTTEALHCDTAAAVIRAEMARGGKGE